MMMPGVALDFATDDLVQSCKLGTIVEVVESRDSLIECPPLFYPVYEYTCVVDLDCVRCILREVRVWLLVVRGWRQLDLRNKAVFAGELSKRPSRN